MYIICRGKSVTESRTTRGLLQHSHERYYTTTHYYTLLHTTTHYYTLLHTTGERYVLCMLVDSVIVEVIL